jgi:hypothetical protein
MVNDIKGLFQSKHAVGGLYIGLIGMIGGELLPSPTDPIDFWLERKWRIQLEKEEITLILHYHCQANGRLGVLGL